MQEPLLPARRLGRHRGAGGDPAARGPLPPLPPAGGEKPIPLVRRDGGGFRLPERRGGRDERGRRRVRLLPSGPRLLLAEGGDRPGPARVGVQAALLHHVPARGLRWRADRRRGHGRGVVPEGREPDPPDPRRGGEGSGPPLPRGNRSQAELRKRREETDRGLASRFINRVFEKSPPACGLWAWDTSSLRPGVTPGAQPCGFIARRATNGAPAPRRRSRTLLIEY